VLPYTPSAIDSQRLSQIPRALRAKMTLRPAVILEIGFGMGDATAHIAALMLQPTSSAAKYTNPAWARCSSASASRAEQYRILQHDAVEVIDHMLPLQSLDGIHISSPTLHKTKHHKRRLIQPLLVAKLAARLNRRLLHCAPTGTYAQQMLESAEGERS